MPNTSAAPVAVPSAERTELLALLEGYILGGFSFAEIRALGPIVALSTVGIRRYGANYRLATMATGEVVLAVRYRRPGREYSPCSRSRF